MISEASIVFDGHPIENTLDLIFSRLDGLDSIDVALKWRNTAKFYESVLQENNES